MQLTSPAFSDGGAIPAKYTCDGDRLLSPPLLISGVPNEARSLVLIVDDPDVPKALKSDGVFDHWVMFNIKPTTKEIREGEVPEGAVVGSNTRGEVGYIGPCPPKEHEPSEHRYIFSLSALADGVSLKAGATKEEVLTAIKPIVLETARLTGRYRRP